MCCSSARKRGRSYADHIDQLPESYRDVLILRDIEELSTQEVADALGLTPTAVKVRLHRGRQALSTLLRHSFLRNVTS
jgi:RNA polymerase sigma-70 factor (ECF subfamily)